MTVVAVKILKNKKIEMSCDNQVSGAYNKITIDKDKKTGNFGKIFKVNGMLIGGAGLLSELNLFKLFCKNHKPENNNVDGVLEFLVEFRDWIAKKTGTNSYVLSNQILFVYKYKIFSIDEINVTEKKDFWAIGSGMFLALSVLHLGEDTKKAVEVAKVYDLFCGGKTETLIINQEENKKTK